MKVKINLEDYDYKCGDGCCDHYGTITTVNDVELPCHNQDAMTIVKQILQHLPIMDLSYSKLLMQLVMFQKKQ